MKVRGDDDNDSLYQSLTDENRGNQSCQTGNAPQTSACDLTVVVPAQPTSSSSLFVYLCQFHRFSRGLFSTALQTIPPVIANIRMTSPAADNKPPSLTASSPAPPSSSSSSSSASPSSSNNNNKHKKKPLSTHLLAGGTAGLAEALVCHPLDTIKVRMQLRGKRSVSCGESLSLWVTVTSHTYLSPPYRGSLHSNSVYHLHLYPVDVNPSTTAVHACEYQFHRRRKPYHPEGRAACSIQGVGCGRFGNRSQDGDSLHVI